MAENENFAKPKIRTFVLFPDEAESGEIISATILWNIENASKAWFEDSPNELLPLAGNKNVLATAPRTFRLFAQNENEIVSAVKTLKLKKRINKLKVLKFSFDKREIFAGDSARLEWEIDGDDEFLIEVFPNYINIPHQRYAKKGYLDIVFTSPGLNDDKTKPDERFFYVFKIKSSRQEILSSVSIKVLPFEFSARRNVAMASSYEKKVEEESLLMRCFKRFSDSDIMRDKLIFVEESVFSEGSLKHLHCDVKKTENEKDLHFVSVFDKNPSFFSDASVQFSIAYAHKHGSGSFGNDERFLHSKIAYAQWKNLLLTSNADFEFKNGEKSDAICIITLGRRNGHAHFSPGKWIMPVGVGSGSKMLIDDSEFPSETINGTTTKAYHVVEGIFDASAQKWIPKSDSRGYGLAFPEKGTWVLNLNALRSEVSIFQRCQDWNFGSGSRNNNMILFNIFHESFSRSSDGFVANRKIAILCDHYLANLKADEFNFTNNKSYWIQSADGSFLIRHDAMRENSLTYATTIGLYNDRYELIAVGKLNRPLKKTWDKEITITLRLDKR